MRDSANRSRVIRRAMILVSLLSDGQVHSLREIAVALQTCERQARRYVEALSECAFPVESERVDNPDGLTNHALVAYQAVSIPKISIRRSRA